MIEKISKMISNLKVLSKMNNIIDGLNTHTTNTNNPHNVTAEQLGLATAYVYKGSVENFSELPTNAQNGWVYSVENEYIDSSGNVHPAGSNFAWNGSRWDDLGGSLSRYTTLDFLEDRLTPITNQVNTNKTNIEDLQNDVDTLNMETIPTAVNKAETAATNAQNAATKAEDAVANLPDNWQDIVNKTDGFVTPEMFGAVGDGEAHIVEGVDLEAKAIQDAIDSGSMVILNKRYYITTSIQFRRFTKIKGVGYAEILYAGNSICYCLISRFPGCHFYFDQNNGIPADVPDEYV